MAKKGLRSWVRENWVDIANPRSDGSFPKCGRSGKEKRRNYPKCVPHLKQDQCQLVKELQQYQERKKLRAEVDQVRNLTTLELKFFVVLQ